MALKPQAGLAIKTSRDDRRARDREEAHLLWAEVDLHIAEALREEAADDTTTPRVVP